MAHYRQSILKICFLMAGLFGAIWMMLNVVAPNPTGRWFSSELILIEYGSNMHGAIAEVVLGHDLNMPQNDSSDGDRICFCSEGSQTSNSRCNTCEVNRSDIDNYRIPDFVNNHLIIDSKVVSTLTITAQIRDFIAVAEQTNRPLWIYVRMDTEFTEQVDAQIEATGGDVVRYFAVEGQGYLMFVEQSVNNILIITLIIAGITMVWQFVVWNRDNSDPYTDHTSYLDDDIDRAEESVEDTEEFMRRMERLSKRKDDDDKRS